MKQHTAGELKYWGSILAADGATVLAANIGMGVTDLSGRRLEQAQLIASETSHMILLRNGDATALTPAGYIQVDGITYVVDYTQDPRTPRPDMWVEVYCHVERTSAQ